VRSKSHEKRVERLRLLVPGRRAPSGLSARTQNNLGAALETLGARESGTARMEEAPCRVTEAVGRAMHDLGDHGQRANGSCANARHEQELREIRRSAFGGSRQIAMQPAGNDVFRSDIVMVGHHQMRQEGLSVQRRPLGDAPLELSELCRGIRAMVRLCRCWAWREKAQAFSSSSPSTSW
jgi:hypothetical protein